MATTPWATADGRFDRGDGNSVAVRAEISLRGLALTGQNGDELACWKPGHLQRSMTPDGFRVAPRGERGALVVDPDAGRDFMRALAAIPDADAPMLPRQIVWTMLAIVGVSLAALVAVAWACFWLIGYLYDAFGSGPSLSA